MYHKVTLLVDGLPGACQVTSTDVLSLGSVWVADGCVLNKFKIMKA